MTAVKHDMINTTGAKNNAENVQRKKSWRKIF